jgi:hypothetical protein
MRWLFFLLLLINIGLFVWIYPQQPSTQVEPAYLPEVKRLVLFSETKHASAESGALSESARPYEQGLVPADNSLPTARELRPEPVSSTSAQVLPSGNRAMPAAETSELAETVQSVDPSTAINPERSGNGGQSGQPRQCRRIGPLAKRSQVDKLSLSLQAMGIQTELHTESTEEQEGYWVMIPPQQNPEAAIAVVKKLREAGVSDLWRFTSGSLADGISLGLFRHESRAEIRLKEIAAKGFDAEVRPRYRQQNRYWLDFSFRVDSPLSEADWNRIAEIYPGLEQRSVDCAGVSSR